MLLCLKFIKIKTGAFSFGNIRDLHFEIDKSVSAEYSNEILNKIEGFERKQFCISHI